MWIRIRIRIRNTVCKGWWHLKDMLKEPLHLNLSQSNKKFNEYGNLVSKYLSARLVNIQYEAIYNEGGGLGGPQVVKLDFSEKLSQLKTCVKGLLGTKVPTVSANNICRCT
jgi:hypothetical protein